MRIVLWIGTGANQKALANKIYSKYKIDLVIIESRRSKVKISFSKILERIADKLFFSALHNAWSNMLSYYESTYKKYPDTQIMYTEDINSEQVYIATNEKQPDLIIVSGTKMIREKLLSLRPPLGIMNLHTGLSPYVKGGPNCTNWCLANNEFHMIGNTIMWIDKGIDSGNIIATETTTFTGSESLIDIHKKVMEHAHELYLKTLDAIVNGKQSNVPQNEIAIGKTYYTKDWNMTQKRMALENYKKFSSVVLSDKYKKNQSALKTVSFS
ncbi:MAG: formyltransferase family protein [Bacteroidota bacterium]